jgi:TonB family protein
MAFRRLLPPCAFSLLLGLAAGAAVRADPAPAEVVQPPVEIQGANPPYPPSLEGSGLRGIVLAVAHIDPQGKVVQVEVIESAHPDFEAAAVKAMLSWTFHPATRNGQPIRGRYINTFSFSLRGPSDEVKGVRLGADVLRFPRTSPASLPSEFYYDQPPVSTLLTAPVYPLDLLQKHVEGKATIVYAIDPKGRTHIVRLDGATDPEFGAAAAAMVLAWQFKPARLAGAATWTLANRSQDFRRDEGAFPVSTTAQRLARELGRNPCPIVRDGLDAPLVSRFRPAMKVPDEVVKAGTPASAVIEIVVDEEGHAQLPRVVSSTDAAFGWAAATAAARWIYDPPAQKGQAVAAFLQVPFTYTPRPPAKAG